MSNLFVISRPCYATREEVLRATDIKLTAREIWRVDRAIQTASENIDGHMHRQFYFEDTTKFFDWPNYQYAFPWRIWLDRSELADVTTNVPVVTSGGTVITAGNIFWGPWNYGPPFTYIEINRSTTSAFGISSTPQRSTSIQGTFGFWTKTDFGGTLAANISTTSATSITVSTGIVPGVGDMIVIDSERFVVQDKSLVDTTQAQQGSGVSTASAADNVLAVTDGTKFSVDEVLLLDSERMLVVDINTNNLTVKRAWEGSVLATHSSAEIFSYRSLTVTRGDLGSTAATHTNGTSISRLRVPGLIRTLAIAEATNTVQQEIGGYADPQGEPGASIGHLGSALADIWDEAETRYGRKSRTRVI